MDPWFVGFLDPTRFIPHEHLAMLDGSSMLPDIAPALHTNLCPVLAVVETSLEPLGRRPPLRSLDSKLHTRMNSIKR